MVKVKMIENPPITKKTRSNGAEEPSTSGTVEATKTDWKNTTFNWDDMFRQIDDEIIENGTIESGNAVRALVRYLVIPSSPFNIKVMHDKLSSLEKRVEQKESEIELKNAEISDLKKKVDSLQKDGGTTKNSLKKQVDNLAIDNYKTKITLANLPLSKSGEDGTETVEETTMIVTEVLKAAGLSLDSTREFRRMYPKLNKTKASNSDEASPKSDSKSDLKIDPNPKSKPKDPKIFIDFLNMAELKKFTSKLKEIRTQEKYQAMYLDNVCPAFLMPDFLKANAKGYQLRKDEGLVTRTFITTEGIVLKTKKKGTNDPFKKVQWK